MPITPFHFASGALFKAAAPARLSWTTFALANALIDLEPILLFLTAGVPAHPWLHTLPGAVLVAAVAALPGRGLAEWWLRWWNCHLSTAQARWLGCGSTIGRGAAWGGALLGTLSHLALDAIMHGDVRPLWPLLAGNPWQGLVAIDTLHLLASACLLPAAVLYLVRCRRALAAGRSTP